MFRYFTWQFVKSLLLTLLVLVIFFLLYALVVGLVLEELLKIQVSVNAKCIITAVGTFILAVITVIGWIAMEIEKTDGLPDCFEHRQDINRPLTLGTVMFFTSPMLLVGLTAAVLFIVYFPNFTQEMFEQGNYSDFWGWEETMVATLCVGITEIVFFLAKWIYFACNTCKKCNCVFSMKSVSLISRQDFDEDQYLTQQYDITAGHVYSGDDKIADIKQTVTDTKYRKHTGTYARYETCCCYCGRSDETVRTENENYTNWE